MIKKALDSIKEIFIPVRSIADDIVVNMDGGVGGSWYTNNDLAKNWGSPIMGAPADY